MKTIKTIAYIILLTNCYKAFSQSETENEQLWIGYLTQSKISKNYSLWNDTHWVPDNFYIIRTGLTFHFDNKLNTTTTLGYALAWFNPPEGQEIFIFEQRPWGQTTISHSSKSFNFFHRLRYEARFRSVIVADERTSDYGFNFRFRYLFQAKLYFKNQPNSNRLYALVSDEIMFNAGDEITNGFRFDQNRIALGLGYQTKNMTFQLAYMKQVILANTTDTHKVNHNLQIFIFHNFDFTKKQNH